VAQHSAAGPQSQIAPSFPDWAWGGDVGQVDRPSPVGDMSPERDQIVRYDTARLDAAVEPAAFVPEQSAEATPRPEAKADPRRLAPRREQSNEGSAAQDEKSAGDVLSKFGVRPESLISTATALTFVLGLFFLGMWTLRRGAKKNSIGLPSSVVGVLGRVTLAPKHFAELLRVGNKLVLVSLTPDGPQPITDITDPAEVDRLTGLCHQLDAKSSSREFEQMFRELANERAPIRSSSDEAPLIAIPPDLAAFRTSGGGRRG
jgi:flagellar biogenesis protein FliO